MAIKTERIETGKLIRLNIMAYGESGSGKTTLIESAMECEYTSPILAIDIDGGMTSVSGSKMELFRPRNMKQMQEVYDFLRYENTTFKAVGVDSLTEMQRKLSMGEILGVMDDDFSYKNLDKHVPADRFDWLSSGEQMTRNIRAFRDLAYLPDRKRRIHVIFTALERYEEKRNLVCPALPGAIGIGVGASVDILGRLSVEQIQTDSGKVREVYQLYMRNWFDDDGVKYLGKARVPKGASFPRKIYNPTVDKLVRYWIDRQTNLESPRKTKGGAIEEE